MAPGRWHQYTATLQRKRIAFRALRVRVGALRAVRSHGWAPLGQRLPGKAPHGKWRTMTFLAAQRHDRIEVPWLIASPINGERFQLYVERLLLPTLKPGDIVIMDNPGVIAHPG